MELRKISLDSREVLKKRPVSDNPMVSMWNEEFTCGGVVGHVHNFDTIEDALGLRKVRRRNNKYGISKREGLASQRQMVDGYRFNVNNNS